MMRHIMVLGLAGSILTGHLVQQITPNQPKRTVIPQAVADTYTVTTKDTTAPAGNDTTHWVDSVFNALTPEERIAQLILIRAHSNLGQDHIDKVVADIRDHKVGGLIFFQGGPVRQAELTNYYQSISKVPLLVAIDGEWGLGMRLDSVISLPRNLMIGALQDSTLAWETGRLIGNQCRRLGIHINFAPDMDVNNNPNNPVINDRSFGENKYQVAKMGVAFIKGIQGTGVMACAKHFPGHGDTDVDSHLDLPVIGKSRAELDSLELYPFRKAIEAGVGSIMMAHLYVPAIDKKPNTPTSISYNATTRLLKNELGFKGLVVTDALEMKGIAKFYKNGEEALQSLLAGNDILELPSSAEASVNVIMRAIKRGQISWDEVNNRVKKVLTAKYNLGLNQPQVIDTAHLTDDLNAQSDTLRRQIAERAITLVKNDNRLVPFKIFPPRKQKLAVIAVGADGPNAFLERIKGYRTDADTYVFKSTQGLQEVAPLMNRLQRDYKAVIISLHNYNRRPANSFGITVAEKVLIRQLQQELPSVIVAFGNPYAIQYFCEAPTIMAAYEDDETTQKTAADILFGKVAPKGRLPISVCSYASGAGITYELPKFTSLPKAIPEDVGMRSSVLAQIDGIAKDMMDKSAAPGCQILAMKDGRVVYNKCFGYYEYNRWQEVTPETIYDLASVTKICATTLSVMRLYDEGKIKLDATLGDYLPLVRGTDKANLRIRDVLLHQAGLEPYIPFYKETLYADGHPDSVLYHSDADSVHTVRVAENMYMDSNYINTMYKRMLDSKLNPRQGYVYSDMDFIFLGKIVEELTGKKLNQYVQETFYDPLGLATTGFRPRERFGLQLIAPTENERLFRMQLLRGDVHDPGAAMFGGVAGHAGLFSNAQDVAVILQMLLNGGKYNDIQFIKQSTIELFTAYGTSHSRRGLGFDKPERDNARRKEPYPAASASPLTFGHTGFTGTCIWVDPQYKLVFIFLSNRVCPDGGANLKLSTFHVRENVMEVLYRAMRSSK